MLPVNAVGERLEGKPHEPFDGGAEETRWSRPVARLRSTLQAEQVVGVVAVLERHQAAVGGLAIGGWHTLCVVAVQEVDVGADLVGLDGGEELLSRRTPTSAPSRNPTIDLSYDRWTSRNERPNQTTVKPILAGLGKHSVLPLRLGCRPEADSGLVGQAGDPLGS